MKRIAVLVTIVVSLVALGAVPEASARPGPVDPEEYPRPVEHANLPVPIPGPQAKSVDTTWVYGGPGTYEGRFETPGGQPDWQGWTHEDLVTALPNHWHISTLWAENMGDHGPGNHAMNCTDETIPSCAPSDSVGGYGNNWFDTIEWSQPVVSPDQAVTVHLTGFMAYDLRDAEWDFLELLVKRGDSLDLLGQWTGEGAPVDTLDIMTVVSPGDFVGPGSNEVGLVWRVTSDGAWSNEDCFAIGLGAARLDDISVFFDDSLITFDDFEPGSPVHWKPEDFIGVGDFTNLRNDLGDRDPCSSNNTWQINWVDDGVVVPGTGGTPCIEHCYDPGGWIVNNDGGLLADHDRQWFLHNQASSPPIAWPSGNDGAGLAFDVYRDEQLLEFDDAGIIYFWGVRSTADPDPADLENAPWLDRNVSYFGGPDFLRFTDDVSDLLVPDATWVQVSLGVHELGWVWGFTGSNGTPGPYFDNVALKAWDPQGPRIEVYPGAVFGDAFPSSGVLDPADLAANSCFVDCGRTTYEPSRIDSMVINLDSIRHGATRDIPPVMHWVMTCNDVFDAVRSETPDGSGILRGSLEGVPASTGGQTPWPDKWAFDLPDSGFFFPGDRLRWYITASDDVAGDIRTSVWPPDTTSVLDFSVVSPWSELAEIRGLPSLSAPVSGVFPHPTLLLIDISLREDFYGYQIGDMTPWLDGLAELGLNHGNDFDVIQITADLHSHLELVNLAKYKTILFVAGTNPNAWHDGFNDDVFDELLILNWLDLGWRCALFSGEQVTGGIRFSTPLENRLGVDNETSDITTVNGGARELQVTPIAWQGVLPNDQAWRLSDGCPDARFTEAINVVPGVGQMAASLDPVGSAIGTYAGLVATEEVGLDNRTLVMPFDLSRIEGYVGGGKNGLSPQADFLSHLLTWLDTGGVSAVDETPGVRQLSVTAHPNPFNPATTISFALPRADAVTLEIFDVQGRKVRTLINDQRYEAGHHEQPWDGRDEGGRGTSSGVYFYRFAAGAEERVGKLTLLK